MIAAKIVSYAVVISGKLILSYSIGVEFSAPPLAVVRVFEADFPLGRAPDASLMILTPYDSALLDLSLWLTMPHISTGGAAPTPRREILRFCLRGS